MRLVRLIPVALVLCGPGPLFAQGGPSNDSPADFFSVNLPGGPSVEEVTYTSEYEAEFPARVHAYADGAIRYSITVVDYTEAERIHTERARNCPPDAHTGCSGAQYNRRRVMDHRCAGRHGLRDVAAPAAGRDADVLRLELRDLVEGRHLQLTNPDGSRTFAAIYMHEDRLYILEATAPRGRPGPELFQQSLRFLDADGNGIRYQTVYVNGFPPPPRVR